MPCLKRVGQDDTDYDALKRRDGRRDHHSQRRRRRAFENTLSEGLQLYPCRILAYQLLPNHWHIAVPQVHRCQRYSHRGQSSVRRTGLSESTTPSTSNPPSAHQFRVYPASPTLP
ncbi:hypothetical protein Rcae01_02169 [Novipirellula caenicola]|uniref:Uncharacterized protein n=1 Tax=Novipirellula caenicola TaxID=1536901 RepID=A0ABP9VNG7_9BACT